MANYNKQFNFRNGVQVDDNNFVVSPTGLVGIGTTIPTESLDVHGNITVTGFVTATTLIGKSLEVSGGINVDTLNLTSLVGGGVSIRNGIITATDASFGVPGIVTYYGDARYLQGMPTSQWVDVDAGLGYTSIYAAGNVGVGTTDPRFTFQVGGNADNALAGFGTGVGISSGGDVLITGITTSGTFVGIGSDIRDLDASKIVYGTISNDRIPVLLNSKLPQEIVVGGGLTVTRDLSVGTAATAIHFESDTIQSGIITATTTFEGSLTGVASSASTLVGTPDIVVGVVTANTIFASSFIGTVTGTASTATSLTTDAEVDIDDLTVGVATVTILGIGTDYLTGRVAIGSDALGDNSDILIRRVGYTTTPASLRLISENDTSTISIGRSDSLIGWNAVLKYGDDDGNYTTPYSLDIINYGDGNINSRLQAGTVGVDTGSFYWHNSTAPIMALTYDGNLGIGITHPEYDLDVTGSVRSTGIVTATDLYLTGSGVVETDLTVEGSLNISGGLTADVTGNLIGNVNITTGISTFRDVIVNQTLTADKIGIGTDISGQSLVFAVNDETSSFIINPQGQVGIRTEYLVGGVSGINAPTTISVFGAIGVATNTFGSGNPCVVDFGNVGSADDPAFATREFMRVPRVTATQIAAFTGLQGGEIVYDTDNNVHKGYNGTTWNDLY